MERVQETHGLGPNGGLVFCLEYLAANVDWLEDKIRTFKSEDCYLLFDLPGQVRVFSARLIIVPSRMGAFAYNIRQPGVIFASAAAMDRRWSCGATTVR